VGRTRQLEVIEVISPASEEVIGQVPHASPSTPTRRSPPPARRSTRVRGRT
jgi:hypothetical protein